MSGNGILQTLVCHVTRFTLLYPVLAEKVDEFNIKLNKQLDDTNFLNPEAGDLYIDELDEADEASHGEISQIPDNSEYANMIQEERPDQENVNDEANGFIWFQEITCHLTFFCEDGLL